MFYLRENTPLEHSRFHSPDTQYKLGPFHRSVHLSSDSLRLTRSLYCSGVKVLMVGDPTLPKKGGAKTCGGFFNCHVLSAPGELRGSKQRQSLALFLEAKSLESNPGLHHPHRGCSVEAASEVFGSCTQFQDVQPPYKFLAPRAPTNSSRPPRCARFSPRRRDSTPVSAS
eukprot:3363407-Rhodomonas_salina.1